MDYDDWLKAGNGARRDESLEDAVRRTVSSAYNFPLVCPVCGSRNLDCPYNDNMWCCGSCDHTWEHN